MNWNQDVVNLHKFCQIKPLINLYKDQKVGKHENSVHNYPPSWALMLAAPNPVNQRRKDIWHAGEDIYKRGKIYAGQERYKQESK